MQGFHARRGAGRWLGLALLLLIGGWTLTAQAGDIFLVCPEGPPACGFATIQEAIAAAQDSPGSTIFIRPGEYAGPVIISNSLTLIGSGAHQVTVTKGIIVAGPFRVELRGMTITAGLNGVQGQSPPGLPEQLSPLLVLKDVVLAGNAQNGLALFNYSQAILEDVTIQQNGLDVLGNAIGGGIALRGHASIAIGGRTVIRQSGANGISIMDEASAQIGPQTFIAQSGLNGILVGGSASAHIEDVVVQENGCFGISVADNASAEIVDGRVERNAKAGIQIGGPSSFVSGCSTLADSAGHAVAFVTGTTVAANPIGVLVGDLSKELDEATADLAFLTFVGNGCDLLVDPVAEKTVRLLGVPIKPCS